MTEFDLRRLGDDSFVLHFGGRFGEADATTFGITIAAVARALQAINNEINPGHELEVLVEEAEAGSYRVRIKTIKRIARKAVAATVSNVVLGLLVNYIWDVMHPSGPPIIVVSEEVVVIEYGDDRVIVSRDILEKKDRIARNQTVHRAVEKAIQTLEEDETASSIGISPSFAEDAPLFELPRSSFSTFLDIIRLKPLNKSRYVDQDTALTIVKAVFERSSRKWEFVWRGFDISAPIRDQSFFDRLEARQISISQGDTFRAKLRIHQTFAEEANVWVNEAYEVLSVGDQIGSTGEQLSASF